MGTSKGERSQAYLANWSPFLSTGLRLICSRMGTGIAGGDVNGGSRSNSSRIGSFRNNIRQRQNNIYWLIMGESTEKTCVARYKDVCKRAGE